MKTLLAALLLSAMAAAQTTITVNRATSPVTGAPGPTSGGSSSASASGSSSANSSSSGPVVTGNGESFAEIPGERKDKKIVVPASLQGGSDTADAGVATQHSDATVAAAKPVGLHFDNPVDGTDSVSVAVRNFQLFCNSHNMAQDEIEVRNWVKANQNIVASSPSEMQRKHQFPLIREQLIGMNFPKEWFEPAAAMPSVPAAPATSK